MSFANIDPILEGWAKSKGIALSIESMANRRRVFHRSNFGGETFQFVVEPENRGLVRIDAHLIESRFIGDVDFFWSFPLQYLERGLELALASANSWMESSS